MHLTSEQFAYATGRIRALENQLLNFNEVERMMLAKDATEAFKVLNEMDFSSHINEIQRPDQFQQILDEGLKDIKSLLDEIVPPKTRWILNIFWYWYDAHNIKTLLKATLTGKKFEDIKNQMSKLGSMDPTALAEFIFEGKKEDLIEKSILEAISESQKAYADKENPQIVDFIIDRAFALLIFKTTKKTGNRFLITFAQKEIDLQNIKAFLRVKLENRDEGLLENALIPNGTIPTDLFTIALKHDIEDFINKTSITPYHGVISQSVENYKDHHSFIQMDRLSDDHLTGFIRESKMIAYGPEPIIAYFWAKKNNASIIQMIMINKLNNGKSEEIREKLKLLFA